MKRKIKATLTKEMVSDLHITYGLDVTAELEKILKEELYKSTEKEAYKKKIKQRKEKIGKLIK